MQRSPNRACSLQSALPILQNGPGLEPSRSPKPPSQICGRRSRPRPSSALLTSGPYMAQSSNVHATDKPPRGRRPLLQAAIFTLPAACLGAQSFLTLAYSKVLIVQRKEKETPSAPPHRSDCLTRTAEWQDQSSAIAYRAFVPGALPRSKRESR
jgi:hypothetical protein